MTFGITIILISVLGYISNLLNNKYLNYKSIKWLYFIGASIHEISHAIACFFTGAKISEISIFTSQPKVVHSKSKIPIIGQMLISFAPIVGGFTFIFLINKFLLGNFLSIQISNNLFLSSINFLSQINILSWQGIVIILLLLNSGAMIGPSFQDIKNTWLAFLILLFVGWNFGTSIGILISALILANIIIQLSIIAIIKIFRK